MKSPIAESFLTGNAAPGCGPNKTLAANDGPAARTEAIAAPNSAVLERNDADLRGNIGLPDR
jgi:hypothetical protein